MAESPQPSIRHDDYKLTGVTVTDETLQTGSYTSDIVLEYMGLKCVGKKIHQALFMQGETTAKVRQLKEQCQLLSQLRHPNVAMFFGLFFQQSPILVTEYVPYTLASCTEQHGVLPDEISYSILHDVALGLSYLHNYTPTIVHGELSASSVLLSPNMTAKISYIGVARLLRLTPPEIRYMAKTNGTGHYTPPELHLAGNGQEYDTSIDVFSYGILMVHTFTGNPPDQLTCTARVDTLMTTTDSSRNVGYDEIVSKDNPLRNLILRCTSPDPQLRPQTDELVRNLAEVTSTCPGVFVNRLEILLKLKMNRKLKKNEEDRELLEEKVRQKKQQLLEQQQEITKLRTENELLTKQLKSDDDLMGKVISSLQHKSPCDEQRDGLTQSEDHESKINTEPPIKEHKSEQRVESPKIYGPKPKVIPRKKAPSKEAQDFIKSSPKIARLMKKRSNSSPLSVTSADTTKIVVDVSSSEAKEVKLSKMIGKGRFFEVWEAQWDESTKVVAKRLKEQFHPAGNIERELNDLKSLHHPNLVQFYGASKQPLCLIAEFMVNGSLLDYLRIEGKSLDIATLIKKAEQIATGMAYLEQRNFMHQNLSARNVMLSKDLVCKVSDHGVARLIRANEDYSVPIFLPKRTAPEAFLHGKFSIKSDVWSYGIVLYELGTHGQLPYLDMSNDKVMKKLLEGYRPPCPEECPEKLYEVMLSCWKEEPERRPTFETLRWQMEDYFSTDQEGYIYMTAK